MEQSILYDTIFFKFRLCMQHSLFMTNATGIAKKWAFITTQIGIDTFCPVFHCHGNMPFGTTFCKFQYGRDNASHIFQFYLL